MNKKFAGLIVFIFSFTLSFAQTNPAAQALPFNFSSQSGGTLPAGVAVHRFGTTSGAIPTTRTLIPGNADLPYNATVASGGWKDEAANGLSILASGSQSAGALVIAINTTGATNIDIQWTARLILQQASWDNNIALQYRIGTSGNFIDIGTTSTFSTAGQVVGYNQTYTEVLPVAAENQPIVQLRFIYWATAGGSGSRDRIALDDISIGGAAPACTEPTNQPTNLILSSTPTTISGSFDFAVPAADEYLIVRSTSNTLSAGPVDGTFYLAGDAIGGGIVVTSTTTNIFTDISLTPATTYYYYLFAHNNENCSSAPDYLQLNPLENNISTASLPACTTPSLPPANLNLTASNTVIAGSFTGEASANRYLSVISTSSTLSASPVNGVTYTAGQSFGGGTIINYTSSTSFTASGLTVSTPYYIFVFSVNAECSGEPFYNTISLDGSATTTNDPSGIPAGYYDAAVGLTCGPLKTALFNIISANYNELTYGEVWTAYETTDMHRNDANTADIIWDMYSDNPAGAEPYTYTYGTNQCGNYNSEADCYNREHSFPKSWFNDGYPMYTDLNHLFPTDGYVNNRRGNQPYGTVSAPTWTSQNGGKLGPNTYPGFSGVVFEPRNEYKGDLARGQLYMVTRYQSQVAGWQGNGNANDILNGTAYPALDDWYIKMLFDWHLADPVSAKEIARNNAVFALQGNRNPFIDHPEYVYQVWQCTGLLPVTLIDFTAQKNNESVLLKWYATNEANFNRYEIERSTDGAGYYKIGEVAGRNLANYSFTDYNLPAVNTVFYRLKMIDIDGKFSNSKIVSVRIANNFSNALIFPNPTKDKLIVKLQTALTENSQLIVADLSGRIVIQQQVADRQKNIDLNVNHLAPGRYFIKISNTSYLINQSFVIIK
ncbi:MAG: endonuclease [Ferruginibacter sp.]|nr:endonuclease [Ferruginibacter sp.]